MLNVRVLIVDGTEIPVDASHSLRQTFDELEAKTRRRFLGGGLWQRKTWGGKLRTQITGRGIAPAGLHSLDTDNPIQIHCVASRGINSLTNIIELPTNRRSDAGSEPFGFAVVGDGMVVTPLAMSVNTATLTVVPGAVQYQARFFPILTVLADPIEEELQRGTGYRWTLNAEEV